MRREGCDRWGFLLNRAEDAMNPPVPVPPVLDGGVWYNVDAAGFKWSVNCVGRSRPYPYKPRYPYADRLVWC